MKGDMKLAQGILIGFMVMLAIGWTYTYDTDTPAGTDAPSVIDDRIREVKDAVQERLNVEHVFDLSGSQVSGTNTGKHTAITCTSVTSTGALSGTTIAGSGNFAVNTNKFTVAAATGNTVVAGTLDVAGAFESTGVATLADASLLKTSAAPTTNAMIANKKYVDDNIGSANYTPTNYAGGQSITFPNGLTVKFGEEPVLAYATDEVTYGAAFDNSVVAVYASYKTTENSYTATANAFPKSGSEKTILQVTNGVNATVTISWLAIGY